MGEHLIDGEFQSDKYPETPRGLVPLKPTDPRAQDLLAILAERYMEIDPEFARDLQEALRLKGFNPEQVIDTNRAYRLIYQQNRGKNGSN